MRRRKVFWPVACILLVEARSTSIRYKPMAGFPRPKPFPSNRSSRRNFSKACRFCRCRCWNCATSIQQEIETNPTIEIEQTEPTIEDKQREQEEFPGGIRSARQAGRGVARLHGAKLELFGPLRRGRGAPAVFFRLAGQGGDPPAASARAGSQQRPASGRSQDCGADHRQHRRSRFSPDPPEEIANNTGMDVADIQRVLESCRPFIRWGSAARDLRECLLIQLERIGKEQTPGIPHRRSLLEDWANAASPRSPAGSGTTRRTGAARRQFHRARSIRSRARSSPPTRITTFCRT